MGAHHYASERVNFIDTYFEMCTFRDRVPLKLMLCK